MARVLTPAECVALMEARVAAQGGIAVVWRQLVAEYRRLDAAGQFLNTVGGASVRLDFTNYWPWFRYGVAEFRRQMTHWLEEWQRDGLSFTVDATGGVCPVWEAKRGCGV